MSRAGFVACAAMAALMITPSRGRAQERTLARRLFERGRQHFEPATAALRAANGVTSAADHTLGGVTTKIVRSPVV